jgi:YedE family putative selenium metabolism protein
MRRDIVWVVAAGAAVGALGVLLVLAGNPANMGFCVACFERDIAGALGLFKPWPAAWIRPEILGILLGAFAAALVAREYRPQGGSSPFLRFVLAMFVMTGALAFLGCPVRMTLRLAGGDLNALVALAGFIAGITGGVLLLKAGLDFGRAHDQRKVDGLLMPIIFVGLLLCAVFLPSFTDGGAIHVGTKGHPGTGASPALPVGWGVVVSLAAGLLVGVLAQRSRLCFAGGVRDMVLIRSPHLLYGFVAVFVVALVGNLMVGKVHLGFAPQPIAHARHAWNFLGMALVGLASVLLGGCPLRQLVLAGSGNSDSALTILGMLAGAAIVHNFGLAAAASTYGKLAVVLGLIVVIAVGLAKREKWE